MQEIDWVEVDNHGLYRLEEKKWGSFQFFGFFLSPAVEFGMEKKKEHLFIDVS